MMSKPLLILLPGLDGTGALFAPLAAALSDAVELRILALPCDGEQTQQAIAQRLLPQLPKEPFVLLAESFSGAVAVEIARLQPTALKRLLLVATFLRTPRPLALRAAPAIVAVCWRWHRLLAPMWWPLCGYAGDLKTRDRVLSALANLSLPILRARLRAILQLNLVVESLPVPVSVVHAKGDRLLPNGLRHTLNRLGDHTVVPGPHFLLQSEPDVLATWVREKLSITSPETGRSDPAS